ncbi:MAG: acyl-CoA thioesterase [Smithella sp.]
MQSKPMSFSRMQTVQQMTQQDANIVGNVHGGVIVKLVDSTAGMAAAKHCGTNVVTASIDRLDFHSPVFVGDILRVHANLNFTGRTSMELGVRVEAENFMTGEIRHTASAYLTFVSLDQLGKPMEIPQVIPETDDEIRRNTEAAIRRKKRMEELCR